MNLSMYQTTVPIYERMLANLVNCLKKAEARAADRDFDAELFLQARLTVDMLPLSKQIQIVSDLCCRGLARLTQSELPSFEDNESTFPELYARIDKTLDYIRKFKQEQIDGTEDVPIQFKVRDHTLNMTGLSYVQHFILPNFYFHITTAYNILRHHGVELGKLDYLGDPQS